MGICFKLTWNDRRGIGSCDIGDFQWTPLPTATPENTLCIIMFNTLPLRRGHLSDVVIFPYPLGGRLTGGLLYFQQTRSSALPYIIMSLFLWGSELYPSLNVFIFQLNYLILAIWPSGSQSRKFHELVITESISEYILFLMIQTL